MILQPQRQISALDEHHPMFNEGKFRITCDMFAELCLMNAYDLWLGCGDHVICLLSCYFADDHVEFTNTKWSWSLWIYLSLKRNIQTGNGILTAVRFFY
jgi:hypothetical protein